VVGKIGTFEEAECFGDNLRARREEKNHTLESLAEALKESFRETSAQSESLRETLQVDLKRYESFKKEFHEIANIKGDTITQWESGKSIPNQTQVEGLAGVLFSEQEKDAAKVFIELAQKARNAPDRANLSFAERMKLSSDEIDYKQSFANALREKISDRFMNDEVLASHVRGEIAKQNSDVLSEIDITIEDRTQQLDAIQDMKQVALYFVIDGKKEVRLINMTDDPDASGMPITRAIRYMEDNGILPSEAVYRLLDKVLEFDPQTRTLYQADYASLGMDELGKPQESLRPEKNIGVEEPTKIQVDVTTESGLPDADPTPSGSLKNPRQTKTI
jgi:transcriptional regulator with XRE-family HTH domain